MALVLLILIFVALMAYGVFLGRLYTGFVLPSLQEGLSFLPSRQLDQVKRYIDNEERAGRKRWYFGLARRSLLIEAGLFRPLAGSCNPFILSVSVGLALTSIL